MKKNILFIADGSLTNPILQSQGLPLLSNLDNSRYKPFVLSFEESNPSDEDSIELQSIIKKFETNINFLHVTINKKGPFPSWFYLVWSGSKILIGIVRNYNIKLLHARSFIPAFLSIIIKSIFKPSIKVIYDNRGVFIDEEIYKGRLKKNSIKVKILHKMDELIIKRASAIVVVSNAFRNHLLSNFEKNINNLKKKIIIIQNGTEHLEENQRAELDSNNPGFIGVYSGSTAKWQRIPDIINLCKVSIKRFSNFKLNIFTYDDPNNIKTYYLGDENLERIINITNLDSSNVKDHLKKGNFGILLREKHILNQVSCPLKFAEYLASGLPVLISEGVGDTESIIKEYGVGVVIYNNNYDEALTEMIKLISDPTIRSRCREVAKKEFNLSSCIDLYKNLYQKLLSS